MSLGTKQNRTFLNIREGRIIKRGRDGQEQTYDYVEGYLGGIYKREREFKGERLEYWYFDLQDPNGGEIYSLSVHYSSGVAKSIINSLASADELGLVRLEGYQSGDYTTAVVYNNGVKMAWKYTELPPVKEIQIGGRMVKDDSQRMEFIERVAGEVVGKINHTAI